MRAWKIAAGLCLLALSAAPRASAQNATSAVAPALSITLRLNHSQLDAEAIRKAVELELKRPVTLALDASEAQPGLSALANPDHTVTVSYRAPNGLIRTRTIGLPSDPSRSAEVIALLAGNLTRDEAAELLAALPTPAPSAAPASTAPTASAPPVPTPAPSVAPLPTPAPKPSSPAPRSVSRTPLLPTRSPINVSLFSPLALYPDSAQRRFIVELGLAYSHVGELHGAGANVFILHTERDVRGVSAATLYNRTDGTVTGATLSAIVNRDQQLVGLQASGVLNLGAGAQQGVVAAGAANLHGDVSGVQAAGAFNQARSVEGLQVAGAVNVAQTIRGLQLGVVNVASEVHGLQIGVVNVAKHVDGTSIGLVSVADNGRLQPVLWASTLMPINAAMKFTVGPLYTQAGLGYAPGNDTYTYELGLGAHIPIGRVFIEPGVHYSEMRSSKHLTDHELLEHGHYRLSVGFDAGPVSPFIGVSVLQRFAHSPDAPDSDPVKLEGFSGVAFF